MNRAPHNAVVHQANKANLEAFIWDGVNKNCSKELRWCRSQIRPKNWLLEKHSKYRTVYQSPVVGAQLPFLVNRVKTFTQESRGA